MTSGHPARARAVIAVCLVGVAPVLITAAHIWIWPRPYHLMGSDIETDYFYNAALLASGERSAAFRHPALPVHYIGALIIRQFGSDFASWVASTQRFLNTAQIVAAALAACSLIGAGLYSLKRVPLGVSLLGIAFVVVWPAFLVHLDYYGAETFTVAAGLPALAVAWSGLTEARFSRRIAVAAGALCGLSLAVKLSFLPVAVAVAAGFAAQAALSRSGRGWLASIRDASIVPFIAAMTFLVLSWPILYGLPEMAFMSYTSRGSTTVAEMPRNFLASLSMLFGTGFPFALFLIVAAALFMFVLAKLGIRLRRGSSPPVGVDWIPPAVFLVFTLLGIGLNLIAVTPAIPNDAYAGMYAGFYLRYALPPALSLPFLLIFCWRYGPTVAGHREQWTRVSPVLGIAALVMIAVSVGTHLAARARWLAEVDAYHEAMEQTIDRLTPPGMRAAVWGGGPSPFGQAGFHFWGSYVYTYSRFDDELVALFPHRSHFHLREVEPASPRPRNRLRLFARRLIAFWNRRVLARPAYQTRKPEIVAGELAGVRPSAVIFIDDGETRDKGADYVLDVLKARFGLDRVEFLHTAGQQFYASIR